MNKRIRALALQANGPNPFYGTLKNQMTLLGDDAVERFAELIVGECIEIIEPCKCGCRCEQEVVITDSIIADIKEHFGVEQ